MASVNVYGLLHTDTSCCFRAAGKALLTDLPFLITAVIYCHCPWAHEMHHLPRETHGELVPQGLDSTEPGQAV